MPTSGHEQFDLHSLRLCPRPLRDLSGAQQTYGMVYGLIRKLILLKLSPVLRKLARQKQCYITLYRHLEVDNNNISHFSGAKLCVTP